MKETIAERFGGQNRWKWGLPLSLSLVFGSLLALKVFIVIEIAKVLKPLLQ